jgi:hypothetical protein
VSVTGRTLALHARTKGESGLHTVIQMAPCMSAAIIKVVERSLSLISEGDEEFRSSMLVSARYGRPDV